jgi:signal transduction histidine kinase
MFEIGCEFKAKGTIPALPQNTILQLYKICQEAVTNSIRHGKARHVSISLAGNGDELILTIKNDGLRFSPPAGAKNRMGLRIMNYRARTIGATLEIKPLKKSGTIVTCAWSMKNGSKTEPAALALAESSPD